MAVSNMLTVYAIDHNTMLGDTLSHTQKPGVDWSFDQKVLMYICSFVLSCIIS